MDVLFYMVAFVTVACAIGALLMHNVVHGVLCLIGAFFNASGLFILLNAEFLAFVMVVVYVGAVALLFLFVLMTFRLDDNRYKALSFYKKPIFYGGLLLLGETIFFVVGKSEGASHGFLASLQREGGNVHRIGRVLYTHYFLPLQIVGVILLVAMIGAIVLLWYRDHRAKQQTLRDQARTRAHNRLTLHTVQAKKGISCSASE
jgi:NADH-quinone oxidoreductase subunit J